MNIIRIIKVAACAALLGVGCFWGCSKGAASDEENPSQGCAESVKTQAEKERDEARKERDEARKKRDEAEEKRAQAENDRNNMEKICFVLGVGVVVALFIGTFMGAKGRRDALRACNDHPQSHEESI